MRWPAAVVNSRISGNESAALFRTDPHADLRRAVGAVEQTQGGLFEAQLVQQLAERLALGEEPLEEGEAELIGEVVDRLLLGGDRAGEPEAMKDFQERALVARLPRLAGVQERQHSLGPLAAAVAPQEVPQEARLDLVGPELEVVGAAVTHPVEQTGVPIVQPFFSAESDSSRSNFCDSRNSSSCCRCSSRSSE